MKKPYFPRREGDPPPLRAIVKRRVRFEEVDPMGIGYADFFRHGVPAPIRKLQIDYLAPLRFQEDFEIEAILDWSDAARLDFEFLVRNGGGSLVAAGCSVQLMLDTAGDLLLVPPPFVSALREQWQAGTLG